MPMAGMLWNLTTSHFKKHLSSAPPHIARIMLRIQKYDAQIKDVSGKNISVTEALSTISSCYGEALKGLDLSVHEVHHHSPTIVPNKR